MFRIRRALSRAMLTAVIAADLQGLTAAQAPGGVLQPANDVLTIDDAVREAVNHNLTLVAERYSVSVARARVLTAQLRPNPVLTYDLMLPDATIFDSNINPLENVFRVDVLLEAGGKRAKRVEVAQDAQSVAELQLLNTVRTLVLDVQGASVDVVLAKQNVVLARESLDAFNALVRVNTDRVRTGDLSQVELSRSRLAALQFQNDVRQREARLAVARGRLRTLLGRTGAGSIDVTGDLRRDPLPIDLDATRKRALELRPDVRALQSDRARAAADVRLQIAQGKVDYTVSGEYHRQRGPHDVAGNQYGLYVSAPLPVFSRNQGEVERARQEERQAVARVAALEADVVSEVQAAYEAYAAARDVVTAIEGQMLSQARNVRATTEYSYRRGEASFVEFLDAVRAFNDTMQSYNEARADYARSLYALEALSGGSPSPQVTP
jgi:outer membrane protein, heavy metal efflux system